MSVKRAIGTKKRYTIGGKDYSPRQIASFIFRGLKERCELRIGQPVRKVVVSVPAYFDETKRRAVTEAASTAGLEVVRLVNEPTAAALGHRIRGDGDILVYDLGGGTFDVSVLHAGDGIYRVLSSRGDPALGGDDFDAALMDELLTSFFEETGIDLTWDGPAMHKLRIEAERAKIKLSCCEATKVEIPFIAANIHGACHLEAEISRETFERRIRGYIGRTIRLTRGALSDAGLDTEDIDHVLLIGGSTRIPAVRRAVEELMGRPPVDGVDPEKVVAEGAAIEAGIVSGTTKETMLIDVTSLRLGIERRGEEFVTFLPRNSVLPAQAKATFTTMSDFPRRAGEVDAVLYGG
jgi:molecular chaperone DnaK